MAVGRAVLLVVLVIVPTACCWYLSRRNTAETELYKMVANLPKEKQDAFGKVVRGVLGHPADIRQKALAKFIETLPTDMQVC